MRCFAARDPHFRGNVPPRSVINAAGVPLIWSAPNAAFHAKENAVDAAEPGLTTLLARERSRARHLRRRPAAAERTDELYAGAQLGGIEVERIKLGLQR